MSVVLLYQGVKADFFATSHSPYGAHYCLSLLQSHITRDFFAPPSSQSFQARSRLTPEKKGFPLDYRPSVVVSDVFAILFARQSRARRTITHDACMQFMSCAVATSLLE